LHPEFIRHDFEPSLKIGFRLMAPYICDFSRIDKAKAITNFTDRKFCAGRGRFGRKVLSPTAIQTVEGKSSHESHEGKDREPRSTRFRPSAAAQPQRGESACVTESTDMVRGFRGIFQAASSRFRVFRGLRGCFFLCLNRSFPKDRVEKGGIAAMMVAEERK
jgi:hypothetical protein